MKQFAKELRAPLVAGLLILAIAFFVFGDPLVEQGLTGSGLSNFTNIDASGTLVVDGASTLTGNVTFGGLVDVNGTADGLVLDTDGDTTLAASTDDQVDIEIGGSDELVLTASTMAMADMNITQSLNTENTGSLPTVLSVSVDIDNDSSPVTCATIADGEVWIIHAVYANVLDNFATGGSNDAVFSVGDGTDDDGLLDLDDGELQAADTEGTGAPAGWQGFMSTDTRGAYFAAGQGFVYAPSGSPETVDCTFGGTGLASDTADTSDDITIYIVYTRIQ